MGEWGSASSRSLFSGAFLLAFLLPSSCSKNLPFNSSQVPPIAREKSDLNRRKAGGRQEEGRRKRVLGC
jgi:hypothetical protein